MLLLSIPSLLVRHTVRRGDTDFHQGIIVRVGSSPGDPEEELRARGPTRGTTRGGNAIKGGVGPPSGRRWPEISAIPYRLIARTVVTVQAPGPRLELLVPTSRRRLSLAYLCDDFWEGPVGEELCEAHVLVDRLAL